MIITRILSRFDGAQTPRAEQSIPPESVEVFSNDAKVYLSRYSDSSTASVGRNNNKLQTSLEQDVRISDD